MGKIKKVKDNFKTSQKPFAFVIMPFTEVHPVKGKYAPLRRDELDTIYALIKNVLAQYGYKVRRAESPTDILRDIVFDLDSADLVVADLTGLNPNVMYELGIRHGFCKKTLLLTQDRQELPFDIAGYQCIEYGWITEREKSRFKTDIKKFLNLIESRPDPRYGPVHTHLGSKRLGVYKAERAINLKHLLALCEELSFLLMGFNLEGAKGVKSLLLTNIIK